MREDSRVREEDVTMEAEVTGTRRWWEGVSQAKERWQPLEAGNGFPPEPAGGTQPCQHLILAQQDPLRISGLQKRSDNKPVLFEVQVHKYSTTWDTGLPEMCHFEDR